MLAAGDRDGFRAALDLQTELEAACEVAVDLHELPSLPVDVQFRVLDEGMVLVDRDPDARVRREVDVMLAYDDFRPYLERIRAATRDRLATRASDG